MRLADGVEMLEINAEFMGRQTIIYPVVISDENDVVLVDTGFPESDGITQIRRQMTEAGIPFERLSRVIITHQDLDHIGGLPELVRQAAHKPEILSHAEEKPSLDGTKKLIKFTSRARAEFQSMPEAQQNQLRPIYENPPRTPVDRTLSDGEELPYGGGLVVIHTAGHTPGHICLYLKSSKILITGDAMNIVNNKLTGPNPHYTKDLDTAKASLKKLLQYDIREVVCYHGGRYADNVSQRIAHLAAE